MNKMIFTGHLGKDPELRYTQGANPTAMCRYTIAVSHGYGEKKKTIWISVVSFGKKAENDHKYLAKGKKVLVEGELDLREWTKQDGTKGFVAEITASNVEYLSPQNENPFQGQYTAHPQGFGQFGQQPQQPPQPAQPMQQPPQQQQFITTADSSQQGPGVTTAQNPPQQMPPGFQQMPDDDCPF